MSEIVHNEDRAAEIKPEAQGTLIPVSHDTMGLSPLDHAQLARFIDVMISAKAMPKHLDNRNKVIAAWNFAAQLKLPPQPSLRNIAIIEGTPSLFGDLPLALVQRHPEFTSYEEFNFDHEYNRICFENKNLSVDPWGGVVLLRRKGMPKPQSFAFTRHDADRAGLIARARPGMPWHTYPGVMYIRRARIMAIRALFADALTGAGIAEDFGYAPDLGEAREVSGIANEINDAYLCKE